MKNKSYVQEKITAALSSLAEGDSDFTTRLESVTASFLVRLNHGDLDDELDEKLSFILSLTTDNLSEGSLARPLDYGERRSLVDAMMSLLEELALA